jgi:hypothetical protein
LETLYKAYEKVGNDYRAAETLELLNEFIQAFIIIIKLEFIQQVQVMTTKHWNIMKKHINTNKNATTAFNYAQT